MPQRRSQRATGAIRTSKGMAPEDRMVRYRGTRDNVMRVRQYVMRKETDGLQEMSTVELEEAVRCGDVPPEVALEVNPAISVHLVDGITTPPGRSKRNTVNLNDGNGVQKTDAIRTRKIPKRSQK
jgi:hypothetical protein